MTSFMFGGNDRDKSAPALAERRKLVNALLARSQSRVPENLWEGLTSLTDAIALRLELDKLGKAEAEAQADATSKYNDLVKALTSKPAAKSSASLQITPSSDPS